MASAILFANSTVLAVLSFANRRVTHPIQMTLRLSRNMLLLLGWVARADLEVSRNSVSLKNQARHATFMERTKLCLSRQSDFSICNKVRIRFVPEKSSPGQLSARTPTVPTFNSHPLAVSAESSLQFATAMAARRLPMFPCESMHPSPSGRQRNGL